MKKLLLATIALLAAASAWAELGSDGYYRVQNAMTKRYAYLLDNKGHVDVATTSADVGALELFSGFLKASSDPATVFYMDNASGINYNVIGQGTNLYALFGDYMKIIGSKNIDGQKTYMLYATKSGLSKYLGDVRSDLGNEEGYPSIDASGDNRCWYINPVEASADNYFGVVPTITAGGKYYAPFYASFPVSAASTGVKFYVITRVDAGLELAVMKEVQGIVPASTPVIVECVGPLASDNKLNVGPAGTPASVPSQLLKGVYFNNDSKSHYNRVAYDRESMRSLAVVDGKLSFGKADYDFVPRNQAYLQLSGSAQFAVDNYQLITEDAYNALVAKVAACKPQGYYRLQDAATGRNLCVLDKTATIQSVDNADLGGYRLYESDNCVFDPASIFHLSNIANSETVPSTMLWSQNTNVSNNMGAYMRFLWAEDADASSAGDGNIYNAYIVRNGKRIFFGAEDETPERSVLKAYSSAGDRKWVLCPVDEQSDANYFGVTPTVQVAGKYYCPFFAAFSFTPASEGMKVYYISIVNAERGEVMLKEVEGLVNSGFPVIIECSSPLPSDNRLKISNETADYIRGNLLTGVWFDSDLEGHENHTAFDKSRMRVLTEKDGKLTFARADLDYVPRNQAILKIGLDAEMAVDNYEVLSEEEFIARNSVSILAADGVVDVYNLDGTPVGKSLSSEEVHALPHGVYLLRKGDATEKVVIN